MKADLSQSQVHSRIEILCSCGMRLQTSLENAGKTLKCPGCKNQLAVPLAPITAAPPDGRSRKTTLMVAVGLAILGCGLFVVSNRHSTAQASIKSANDRILQAVLAANEWIGGKSHDDAEVVERQLSEALASEVATNKSDGEMALAQVRQKRIFDDAKQLLQNKKPVEAIAQLREYLAGTFTTEADEARKLLDEIEISTSEKWTTAAMMAMDNTTFDRVVTTLKIEDRKVTDPAVLAIRSDVIQRILGNVAEQREAIRMANEIKAERLALAAIERENVEKESRLLDEQLRSRMADLRNVCWGDSPAIIKKVQEESLKDAQKVIPDAEALTGEVDLDGTKAVIIYRFYKGKLIQVTFFVNYDAFGNPFGQEISLGSSKVWGG